MELSLPISVPPPTPQNRPFTPTQPRNPQNNFRSVQTVQQRLDLHYQATLPPTPCHVCLNLGIPNAYHWIRDCPFRKQTLKAASLTQNLIILTQNPEHTRNEFHPNTGSNHWQLIVHAHIEEYKGSKRKTSKCQKVTTPVLNGDYTRYAQPVARDG